MKRKIFKLFLICIVGLLMLTGCTITTTKEEADEYGNVLKFFGFEKCETSNCE